MTLSSCEQNPERQAASTSSLLSWLICHALALLAIFVVLLVVVPRFDRMFAEFGLKLPVLTGLVINASRGLRTYGLLIIPAGLLVHAGMLCLLFLMDGVPRRVRSLYCVGVLIAAGGTLLIIVIGLVVPLLRLVEGLS